jgi:O-antigen ligase
MDRAVAAIRDSSAAPLIAAAACSALLVVATFDLMTALMLLGAVIAAIAIALALRDLLFAGALLVITAALDATGRLGTVAGVQLTVYQAMAALTLVLLVLAWRRGEVEFRHTPVDLPLAFFLFVVVASIPLANDVRRALVAVFSLFSSAFLAYAISMIVRRPRHAEVLVCAAVGMSAFLGGLAFLEWREIFAVNDFLQVWGYGIRAKTTFEDPNIYGSFAMTAVLLATPWLLVMRNRKLLLLGGGIMFSLAGLFFTASRGAWVGVLVGFLVVLAFARMRVAAKVATAVAGIAFVMVVLPSVISGDWFERRVLNFAQDTSGLARVHMARAALEIAAERPEGVGPGNYPVAYPFYRYPDVRPTLIESHTAYLTVLVEIGFVGLLLFLAALAVFLAWTLRAVLGAVDMRVHAAALGSLAAVVGMMVQSLTYSLETSKFLWFSIGLGLAAIHLVRNQAPDAPAEMSGVSSNV